MADKDFAVGHRRSPESAKPPLPQISRQASHRKAETKSHACREKIY
jgi:hypothetical protein